MILNQKSGRSEGMREMRREGASRRQLEVVVVTSSGAAGGAWLSFVLVPSGAAIDGVVFSIGTSGFVDVVEAPFGELVAVELTLSLPGTLVVLGEVEDVSAAELAVLVAVAEEVDWLTELSLSLTESLVVSDAVEVVSAPVLAACVAVTEEVGWLSDVVVSAAVVVDCSVS